MNILLDPYILAVPEQPDKAAAYLDTLNTWTKVIRSEHSLHHVWLSRPMLDALWHANCYPTWDLLTALEEHLPPDKPYNVHTLFRACEPQLTEPPLLDELLANATHYYDNDQVIVIPEAIARRLPALVADALRDTLALAALGYTLGAHATFADLVFGTNAETIAERSLHVDFTAQDIRTDQATPVRHRWEIVTSPELLEDDLSPSAELCELWEDTVQAVVLMYQVVYRGDSAPPECPAVVAHASFNRDLARFNVDRQPAMLAKVFRKFVMGVTGAMPRNTKYHHPLHHNGKAVRKGETTAWRLWVESSTPGWRLHYWLYTDGCVELASFVKHDDYSIPDPSR